MATRVDANIFGEHDTHNFRDNVNANVFRGHHANANVFGVNNVTSLEIIMVTPL